PARAKPGWAKLTRGPPTREPWHRPTIREAPSRARRPHVLVHHLRPPQPPPPSHVALRVRQPALGRAARLARQPRRPHRRSALAAGRAPLLIYCLRPHRSHSWHRQNHHPQRPARLPARWHQPRLHHRHVRGLRVQGPGDPRNPLRSLQRGQRPPPHLHVGARRPQLPPSPRGGLRCRHLLPRRHHHRRPLHARSRPPPPR